MNKVTKPGNVVKYPIYLTSLDELHDMTFQLTFPERLIPSMAAEDIEVSAQSTGYTVSIAAGEEANAYIISLIGGSVPDVSTALLTFTINVPEDIVTAQNYQVIINQVSVTEAGGNTLTASTRNGRISVYKNGDANGDNTVDVYDYIGIANDILHMTQDGEFIREAGDVNDSGEIDVYDYMGVANIILYGTADGGAGSRQQTNASEELVVEPE